MPPGRKPELVLPGWQVLPWEVEGKRAVPEDGGMTLSSLSLGPEHLPVGTEVFIVLGSDPGLLSQGPAHPSPSLLELL